MSIIRKVDISVILVAAGCAAYLFWNGDVPFGLLMVGVVIMFSVGRVNQ